MNIFIIYTNEMIFQESYIYLFIPYYKYQTAWHTAHTPQSCILGGGWFIIRSGEWKLKVSSNKFIPVKYMWLKKGNEYIC